jgi:hypothetical protein
MDGTPIAYSDESLIAVDVDPAGRIYYATLNTLYRLTPSGTSTVFSADQIDPKYQVAGVAAARGGSVYASLRDFCEDGAEGCAAAPSALLLNDTPVFYSQQAIADLDTAVGCDMPVGWAINNGFEVEPYKKLPGSGEETGIHASGAALGRIPRFKRCTLTDFRTTPYYPTTPVVFKNEETGLSSDNDYFVDPAVIEPLVRLASMVQDAFGGLYTLRVTDAYDLGEEVPPHRGPLHYEGRALDLTLTRTPGSPDLAPSPGALALFGCLAQLAHNAGFAWSFYENSAHVHVSVPSSFGSIEDILTGECPGTNWTIEFTPPASLSDCQDRAVLLDEVRLVADEAGVYGLVLAPDTTGIGIFSVLHGQISGPSASGQIQCYLPQNGTYGGAMLTISTSLQASGEYVGTYSGEFGSGTVTIAP